MRTLRIAVALGLLAVALTTTTTATAAAAPTADATRWRVAATLGLAGDDVATSCPTVDVCTAAAGGELLTTADGGATWTPSTAALPADVIAVTDLDCPTVNACTVVARTGLRTTEILTGPGTGPFTAAAGPDAGTATGIACPGPAHCLLTDGQRTWTTRDRGATWRQSSLPAIAFSSSDITCVTGTNRCAVYGNNGFTPIVDVTTDDGRIWTQQNPGAFDGLYALDCPTVSVCVAGGRVSGFAVMRRTTDGGATWKPVGIPGQPYGVRSVSCATETSCSAFGLTPGDTPYEWSTTNGTTWTADPVTAVDTSPSPEVDCPAAGRCRAVAGGIAYRTDDGTSWADQSLPAGIEEPRALSCPKPTACVAVTVDAVHRPVAITSTDSGATWTRHDLPAAVGQPTSVDCIAGTSTCVLVAAYSAPGSGRTYLRSATTTDFGTTWSTGRPTGVRAYLWTVSCASTTTCLGGGYDEHSAGFLWLTTDGAATWTAVTPPTGLSQDNEVACTGPTTCVVASSPSNARPVAFVTSNLGRTWKQHLMPGDPDNRTYYASLSCATTTCVALGSSLGDDVIARSADGGATWQRATVPFTQGSLDSVSCASDTVCAASGSDFAPDRGAVALGTRDGGVTWIEHRVEGGRIGYRLACAGNRCYSPTTSRFGSTIVVTGSP